ncbi:MAG: sugar ABC transporter substrate-binding protein [Deltaproteobacteria bacterium]|jgi:multiple sugar transport system substrate-binding protein|nr:sugar ABC transporter substrate-binding protein [Deltaproteobacteria bacterium]
MKKVQLFLISTITLFLLAMSGPMMAADMLPAALKAGKPYNGTAIDVFLCCPKTGQFQQWYNFTPEFTKMTGIDVKYHWQPWGNAQEKIMNEFVSDTGAFDVMIFLDAWGPGYQNYLEPLNKYIARDGLDIGNWPPAFINGATYGDEGNIYGMPVRGHAQLLFYRADIFDKLGLKAPKTFAELETASKKITAETDMHAMAYYYGRGSQAQNLMVWMTYLWGNGGDLFDKNWKPVFNSARAIEATKRYTGMLTDLKVVPPNAINYAEGEGRKSVMQGESAMTITWWWAYANMTDPKKAQPEVVKGLKFASVPSWEGRGSGTYALSMPLGMAANSDSKDASWEFIKWISNNKDLQKKIALDTNFPNNVVSLNEAFQDSEINAHWDNIQKTAFAGLKNSDVMPMIMEWAEISTVLETSINSIASGKDAKSELDQAAKEVEEIMEREGYYQ